MQQQGSGLTKHCVARGFLLYILLFIIPITARLGGSCCIWTATSFWRSESPEKTSDRLPSNVLQQQGAKRHLLEYTEFRVHKKHILLLSTFSEKADRLRQHPYCYIFLVKHIRLLHPSCPHYAVFRPREQRHLQTLLTPFQFVNSRVAF